jgi:Family of unknown function (DUF5995)
MHTVQQDDLFSASRHEAHCHRFEMVSQREPQVTKCSCRERKGNCILMNEDPHSCQKILALLAKRAALATIGEVIQVMQDLDSMLLSSDGLKWFNLLYLCVTQAVYENPPAGGWGDQKWLTRLYFDALASSCLDPTKVPRAWMALFEARDNPGIERVQFALAGINAHINHDLPLASVQTGKDLHIPPDRNSREYSDFDKVNSLLNEVMPGTLKVLATGILGELAQDTGTIGRLLAMWSVKTARDTAWTNAELLWELQGLPSLGDDFMMVLDRMTGLAGRGLLLTV